MRLEHVRVALRPRTAGEALDLGCAMLRAWIAPLSLAWCLTSAPVALALCAALPVGSAWTYALWWWLAPLFERPLQFVLSRAVFGSAPSAREVLRALPRLWTRQPLRGLLLHRLDPWRGVVQPAAQLEGVRGATLRSRERLLRDDNLGGCLLLMTAAAGFEVAIAASLVVAACVLAPSGDADSFERTLAEWMDPDGGTSWFVPAVVFVSYSVGCAVRACAGFALYLNRRTEVEGWDLEVALRVLAQRVRAEAPARVGRGERDAGPGAAASIDAAPRANATTAALSGFAVVLALAASTASVRAEPTYGAPMHSAPARTARGAASDQSLDTNASSSNASASDAARSNGLRQDTASSAEAVRGDPVALADEILDGPEFHQRVKTKELVSDRESRTQRAAEPNALSPALGRVLQIALWGALVAALAFVVWWIAVRTPPALERAAERPAAPVEAFGLDIRVESLPADVAAAASALFATGDARAALSLLYRGAIARLVEQAGLEIGRGDTEADCVARVHAAGPGALAQYFAELTRAWTRLAWSREALAPAVFTELCGGWRRAFERGVAP